LTAPTPAPSHVKRRGKPKASSGTNDLYDVNNAENINLWLPSSVPAARRNLICKHGVDRMEARFRLAQLSDFLSEMRKYMQFYAILRSQYKGEFTEKSSNVTRAREELTKYKNQFMGFARKYRKARAGLLLLDPEGELCGDTSWSSCFQELKNNHLKGPYLWDDQTDLVATNKARNREIGGGHYDPAWYWKLNLGGDDERSEPIDQIRVQVVKLWAHADRWDEEELRLPEEMRCTLHTFKTEASEWRARIGKRHNPRRPWLQVALDAYAHRQASLRDLRREQYAREWLPLLNPANAGTEWTHEYQHLVRPVEPKQPRRVRRAAELAMVYRMTAASSSSTPPDAQATPVASRSATSTMPPVDAMLTSPSSSVDTSSSSVHGTQSDASRIRAPVDPYFIEVHEAVAEDPPESESDTDSDASLEDEDAPAGVREDESDDEERMHLNED
jgi:hypothetical protein